MKKRLFLIILLPLLGLLVLSVYQPSLVVQPASATTSTPAAPAVTSPALAGSLTELEKSLENIYTTVNPAVVSIQVVQKQQVSDQTLPDFPGFPFFFGPDNNPNSSPQAPRDLYRQGAGSGFIWDKEGHIITNNHVVEGADKIRVTFADGMTVIGKVVGTDPASDLAVVKVDVPASELQPVQVGDSTQVKVGQLAIALGNPFTLENTMTVGFVSAIGRQLPVSTGVEDTGNRPSTYTIPDIIQTDAPINPGNSGGVLVNDQGQVIGVTAAIESPVRASAGIGFAIPSAIVQKVVPVLIKDGKIEHPWLGLSGMTLNPDLAQAMGLKPDQRGALVVDVTPHGPADQAGLQGSDRQMEIDGEPARVGGDVITSFNDQPVKSFDELVASLARTGEVGQSVNLTILRDGQEKTISIKLAARPTSPTQNDQEQNRNTAGQAWLGVQGMALTPAIAKALELPDKQQAGVLVQQVEINSPADKAGLRGGYKPTTVAGQALVVGGDIITALDDQPVSTPEDIQAFLQQATPGQKVNLTLLRNGQETNISVSLGQRPAAQ